MNNKIESNRHFTFSEKLWVLIFFLCIYLLSTSGGIFHSIDGEVLYSVGKNMVTKFNATIDGQHYSQYAPLQSILEGIAYLVGTFFQKLFSPLRMYGEKFLIFSALSVNVFATALTCLTVLLFANMLFLNKKLSYGLSLVYGLSTMAWVHSKWDMAEPLATLAIFFASYLLYKFKLTRKNKYLIIAGCSFGMAIATKYYPLIILPAMYFYLFKISGNKKYKTLLKNLGMFSLPLAIIIILLLGYNWSRFGNPFETNYPFVKGGIDFRPEYFYAGLYGLLFSPGKGIFFYNPIIVLSIFGISKFYEKYKNECIYFIIAIFLFLGYFGSFLNWQGGYCWGPRHLAAIIPFLILIVGISIQQFWRKHIFLFFFCLLLIYGIFVQILGISVNLLHFYGSVMQNQLWHWVYFPFFSPIVGSFWIFISLITGIAIPYPVHQPFDLYLGSVSGTQFDLLFLNSLLRNGHFFLKFVSGVLLALAILALYNLWKKLNFRILRFSYKRIFIAIFSILFIFALLSPLKSLNIFYNELKIIPIPVPNSDFLTDSGENYGSGDSEANNGIPDGWEFGDWSPKRPAASLSLSSQHYKKDGTSLEIKTLNSPAFFRLRTILIPISCYKRIIISSYMKKDNGLSPFYWAAFFDQDYRILTDMQGIRFFNKFEDWKLAKFECIVPEQAYYIQVSVSLWGNVELNRRFWIDSISLYGKK